MRLFIPLNGDQAQYLLPKSGEEVYLPNNQIYSESLRDDEDGNCWGRFNKQGDFTWWHSRSRMLKGMTFLGYEI